MKLMTVMSIRNVRYSSDPTFGLSKASMFAMSAGGFALFLVDEEPRERELSSAVEQIVARIRLERAETAATSS